MKSQKHGLGRQDEQGGDACRAELEQALAQRSLAVRYRPVAALSQCQVHGHLALGYGPKDSPVRSLERYFVHARLAGLLPKLTRRYLEAVLEGYAEGEGRLLLSMPALAVATLGEAAAQALGKAIRKTGRAAESLVVVHPGILSRDAECLEHTRAFTQALRPLGVAVATRGFCCAPRDLDLWAGWQPQLILLDEEHFEDLDGQAPALDRLRRYIAEAHELGRQVLAQGIGGQTQLSLAEELGCDLVAGDFIGKASVKPYQMLSAAAFKAIRKHCACVEGPQPSGPSNLLDRLLVAHPPVGPDTQAEAVFHAFEIDPELRALAVVEDGRPLGIISRYEMVDNMARPFRHELFGRKPCARFMDPEPLTLDVRVGLPELMDQVIQAPPRHLISGFIVTDNGAYLGMGAVQDLMREITSMQLEAARYANPLTQLPGNVPINQHLDSLLAAGLRCVVAYCDLDHFKPFNDVYGYAKGDEIILLTARCLKDSLDPDLDFLGHVGGDDFVVIYRSTDWRARCEQVLLRFGEAVLSFFSPSDIEQGGYLTSNRKGDLEFHPLASLSIGAVEAEPGAYASHLAVAAVAAEVKKRAKAIKGNSLYVNQRRP